MKMLISVLLIVVETIIDKVEDCSVNYYAAGVQRGEKKSKGVISPLVYSLGGFLCSTS